MNDPVRLQQVISNIVNNSIKFTESGFVLLYVWKDENYLKIEIRDSGIGMTHAVVMSCLIHSFKFMTKIIWAIKELV
ncbi:hypothetical protein J4731_24415 [Providencia rettgeri]|nr:hypothetical protein [Providencia rettgeri]